MEGLPTVLRHLRDARAEAEDLGEDWLDVFCRKVRGDRERSVDGHLSGRREADESAVAVDWEKVGTSIMKWAEEAAGRKLTQEEVDRLVSSLPLSTVKESLQDVVWSMTRQGGKGVDANERCTGGCGLLVEDCECDINEDGEPQGVSVGRKVLDALRERWPGLLDIDGDDAVEVIEAVIGS